MRSHLWEEGMRVESCRPVQHYLQFFFTTVRDLQEEYERLRSIRDQSLPPSDSDTSPGGPQNRDSELLAEAKLLRQHKGRLEARMQVLEDHNRQLEAQLQRLRQLLDQVKQVGLKVYTFM